MIQTGSSPQDITTTDTPLLAVELVVQLPPRIRLRKSHRDALISQYPTYASFKTITLPTAENPLEGPWEYTTLILEIYKVFQCYEVDINFWRTYWDRALAQNDEIEEDNKEYLYQQLLARSHSEHETELLLTFYY